MTNYPKIFLKKSFEKYDWYELVDDCQINILGYQLIIPCGYKTDFASVPQFFWSIIPPHCKAAMPSIVHDYLCEFGILQRKDCDAIFFELLKIAEVSFWQRNIMYAYVRAFGWVRYNKKIRN